MKHISHTYGRTLTLPTKPTKPSKRPELMLCSAYLAYKQIDYQKYFTDNIIEQLRKIDSKTPLYYCKPRHKPIRISLYLDKKHLLYYQLLIKFPFIYSFRHKDHEPPKGDWTPLLPIPDSCLLTKRNLQKLRRDTHRISYPLSIIRWVDLMKPLGYYSYIVPTLRNFL